MTIIAAEEAFRKAQAELQATETVEVNDAEWLELAKAFHDANMALSQAKRDAAKAAIYAKHGMVPRTRKP